MRVVAAGLPSMVPSLIQADFKIDLVILDTNIGGAVDVIPHWGSCP